MGDDEIIASLQDQIARDAIDDEARAAASRDAVNAALWQAQEAKATAEGTKPVSKFTIPGWLWILLAFLAWKAFRAK